MKRYLSMIVLAIAMTFIFDWNKHMIEVAIFYALDEVLTLEEAAEAWGKLQIHFAKPVLVVTASLHAFISE